MAQAKLQITIISAENLYNSDNFFAGKSDPYVICEVPGQPQMKFQTPSIKDNLNPEWNFVGEIDGFMDGDTLEFQVWDSDFGKSDDLLGKANLTAADFYPQGLEGALQLSESKTNATLSVRVIVLETTDPGQDPAMMQPQEGLEYQPVDYQQQGMVDGGMVDGGMVDGGMVMPEQVRPAGPQTLHVNVLNARGLYNADGFMAGKSDPYCICLVPGKKNLKFQTKTLNNILDPDWNHTGLIHGFEAGDSLEFQVWDADTFPKPDQLLGKVVLSPQDFDANPAGINGVLQLSGGVSKDQGSIEVEVNVDVQATQDDADLAAVEEATHQAQQAAHGSSGQVAPAGGVPAGHVESVEVKRLSVSSQNIEKLAGAKMAKLKVTVFCASGLYNADGFLAGKSDPYVICQVPGNKTQKFKTKVINNTLEPTWNHLGVINAFVVGHTLEFEVYDSDTPPKPDQLLGKVELSSDEFFPHGLEGAIALSESKSPNASLSIRIEVLPDTQATGLTGAKASTTGHVHMTAGMATGSTMGVAGSNLVQVRPGVYQYQTTQTSGSVRYQPQAPQQAYMTGGSIGGGVQYISGGMPTTTMPTTYTAYGATTAVPTMVSSSPVADVAFNALDANHDGVISRSEFVQAAAAEPMQPVATKVEYTGQPTTYTSAQPVTYTTAQPATTYMAPQPAAVTYAMPATTITAPATTATAPATTTLTAAPATTAAAPATTVTAPAATYQASAATYQAPATTVTAPAATYQAPASTVTAPAATYQVQQPQQLPSPMTMTTAQAGYQSFAFQQPAMTATTAVPQQVSISQPASSVKIQPAMSGSISTTAGATTMAPVTTAAPVTIASTPQATAVKAAAPRLSVAGGMSMTASSASRPVSYAAPATYAAPAATTYAAPAATTYAAPAATTYAAPAATTYAAPAATTYAAPAATTYAAPAGGYTMQAATYAAPSAGYAIQGATYATGATYTMAQPGQTMTVAGQAMGAQSLFDRLDKNHDGVISKAEFTSQVR